MKDQTLKGLLVSDFNVDILGNYLNNLDEGYSNLDLSVTAAPFGQVMPVLMNPSESIDQPKDFLFVWTQPDRVFGSFKRFVESESVGVDDVLDEVDQFCRLVLSLKSHVTNVFVATWALPSFLHHRNILQDMKSQRGLIYLVMKMNVRLMENFSDVRCVHVLDSQKWLDAVGQNASNPKMWYLGKIPFDQQVFKAAAKDVKAALSATRGETPRLVLVDLDDTLWGGILGDAGWENVKLGGHDPIGEAFADFQHSLKLLKNQGILLGIVSKNEESVALEAIRRHPEMILKEEDFVGWRINWQDKAQNILELAKELNLGLQSIVFIDDNPAERGRVRDMLPEVLVPEWPKDKLLYRKTLVSLGCFNNPQVTSEDLNRTTMYTAERQRQTELLQVGSIEEWIKGLDINVTVQELEKSDLARATQLLNKVNQMNLTTRRMTEDELWTWVTRPGRKMWTFRVADKFCDSGLTGIVSVEVDGSVCNIIDFILSCRVFSRKVEECMMHTVYCYAYQKRLTQVQARYLPTKKNKPCLDFLQRSGMENLKDNQLYSWNVGVEYPAPEIAIRHIMKGTSDESVSRLENAAY